MVQYVPAFHGVIKTKRRYKLNAATSTKDVAKVVMKELLIELPDMRAASLVRAWVEILRLQGLVYFYHI